ncbi:MAG: chemotaxis protein CheR, partial [Proteobacteria bacterium]|nr:chemotaxis protein CheR [Pseudomonadota bacterium]
MVTTEVKITDKQFKQLSDIVYKETGIVLDEKKYNLLVARLSKRMRKTKTKTVSDYVQLILDKEEEFANFIDATTTNHTFFFRENKH